MEAKTLHNLIQKKFLKSKKMIEASKISNRRFLSISYREWPAAQETMHRSLLYTALYIKKVENSERSESCPH